VAQVRLILSTHLIHLSTKQSVTVVAFTDPFGFVGEPELVGVVGVVGVELLYSGDEEDDSS
jgi:hypothetical protein